MTQLALELDRRPHTLARADDPPTSKVAAVVPGRKAIHRRRVLEAYRHGDPITDVEAARRANLERIETTRRASELRGAGLIEPLTDGDGNLVTAKLPSGRSGMVCRITDAGAEALAA